MNYNKMIRVMALVMGASIALTPVTAFASEAEQDVVAAQESEAEVAKEAADEEVVSTDTVVETEDKTAEAEADESEDQTAEVEAVETDEQTIEVEAAEVADGESTEAVDEETVDVVADETAANEITANQTLTDENASDESTEVTAEASEASESATPVLDKKALKLLNDAAYYQDLLKNNSFKTGLAATNQVDRCRNLAKNLLVYKLNYIDGMLVIGTSYDMFHGDNNYICVTYKNVSTGEIFEKYYDFYMQDSNGNNVTNALKYHTVDRITIVEKGALTGQKKIGMYVYPTFECKSNGNVVFDYDSYSQLISQENRDFVSSMIQ